jgi:hypothetical protein
MLRGSCLCGGVRYEISGALSKALNCHCSMCRKAHGAAFRSRARVLSRFDRDPAQYGLPLGALDDDPGIKPKIHVFVAYKAPWFDITDDLQQFPELRIKDGLPKIKDVPKD